MWRLRTGNESPDVDQFFDVTHLDGRSLKSFCKRVHAAPPLSADPRTGGAAIVGAQTADVTASRATIALVAHPCRADLHSGAPATHDAGALPHEASIMTISSHHGLRSARSRLPTAELPPHGWPQHLLLDMVGPHEGICDA